MLSIWGWRCGRCVGGMVAMHGLSFFLGVGSLWTGRFGNCWAVTGGSGCGWRGGVRASFREGVGLIEWKGGIQGLWRNAGLWGV